MKLGSSSTLPNIYTIDSNGKPVAGIPVNQFTDRLEFRGDTSKSDFTLAIRNFVQGDEGIFTCEIKSSEPFRRAVTLKATGTIMLNYVVYNDIEH